MVVIMIPSHTYYWILCPFSVLFWKFALFRDGAVF